MVEQKVFRSGHSLVVVLPKKFCKRNMIVKGDKLEVSYINPDLGNELKVSLITLREKEVDE